MTTPTLKHQLAAAQQFAAEWQHATDERREKDSFWNDFFAIFGMNRKKYASFEYPVKDEHGNTQFIDIFYKGVFLAEHKSAKKNLATAREQAERYIREIARTLPAKDLPEFYAVSDFAQFHLYRREPIEGAENQWQFPLSELPQHIERGVFQFMLGLEGKIRATQAEANIRAAEIIGKLHDAFRAAQIYNPHELRLFITRLLFLFFADDSLVFARNYLFEDFIAQQRDTSELGLHINSLFEALNTPNEKWSNRQKTAFAGFEYVNGGLFADRLGEFEFTPKLRQQLETACRFDWSGISPEIFGTLFQSVMNSEERREAGAHYTEADNIEKVINSLFLNDLKAEFAAIQKTKSPKTQTSQLNTFYRKLQSLRFLDPACGCGNFLIVAYDHLRQLEDDVIAEILASHNNDLFGGDQAVQCHLNQFHGIEIDEFASMIARVAMWLKNHQCNRRTYNRFAGNIRCETLPLKDEAHILNANSLHTEWARADYIFGNPPFIGKTYQTAEQKADMKAICGHFKNYASLDYVCAWYVKAAALFASANQHSGKPIACGFVSTNSITQGEQVPILWQPLLSGSLKIHFAHRTFQWTSAASGKAAVHCVIIGITSRSREPRETALFDYPDIKGQPEKHLVQQINPYLIEADDGLLMDKRRLPISGEAEMVYGNKPTDGGFLLMTTDEKNALIATEPLAEKYIRPFLGADEFINGKERWCLWFTNCDLVELNNDLQKMPQVAERLAGVKKMREDSTKAATQKLAATPHLFGEIRQPENGNYLLIPSVSSENRDYIPIDYVSSDVINSNANFSLPNASLYHFGVMMSAMHNAFMRTVAGRLKSDYRYSNTIVYNNFPFPFTAAERTAEPLPAKIKKHIDAITAAAQKVLDVRQTYRQAARNKGRTPSTLAQFYNAYTVHPYPDLLKAHAALNKAVDAAYGYTGANHDSERVAFLFDLYQQQNQ